MTVMIKSLKHRRRPVYSEGTHLTEIVGNFSHVNLNKNCILAPSIGRKVSSALYCSGLVRGVSYLSGAFKNVLQNLIIFYFLLELFF